MAHNGLYCTCCPGNILVDLVACLAFLPRYQVVETCTTRCLTQFAVCVVFFLFSGTIIYNQ